MFCWPFHDGAEVSGRWWRRGGPRSVGFASARGGGRLHAACDLRARRGTLIRAIAVGTVLDYSSFYEGTYELVVAHQPPGRDHFIARYGEVLGPPDGIAWANGQTVAVGADIARVGQLDSGGSMLHLELYASTQWPHPSLSIARRWHRPPDSYSDEDVEAIQNEGRWLWNFQRRTDLADPTDFLLALRDGRSPPQLVPVTEDRGIVMEALRVTPSEGYRRRQHAIARRRRERMIRTFTDDYLRVHGSRLRIPGSAGMDVQAELHREVERQRRQWVDEQRRMSIREILSTPGTTGAGAGMPALPAGHGGYNRHGPD
jgi:hypothetical protein